MTDLEFDADSRGRLIERSVALTAAEYAAVKEHAKERGVSASAVMRARIVSPSLESAALELRCAEDSRAQKAAGARATTAATRGRPRKRKR
jgi:hypothetical protein